MTIFMSFVDVAGGGFAGWSGTCRLVLQCYRQAINDGDVLCSKKSYQLEEHVPAFACYELAVLLGRDKQVRYSMVSLAAIIRVMTFLWKFPVQDNVYY